jgi:hypothetical protein
MKNRIVKRVLDAAILITLLAAATQTASARHIVPDTGSTSVLMVIACAGLTAIRRIKR